MVNSPHFGEQLEPLFVKISLLHLYHGDDINQYLGHDVKIQCLWCILSETLCLDSGYANHVVYLAIKILFFEFELNY